MQYYVVGHKSHAFRAQTTLIPRYDTVLQNFRWSEDFALWETSFLDVSKAAAP